MFGRKEKGRDLEREVVLEMEILKKLHGEDAPRIAREKAMRPTNRTFRQKVLDTAVRRLEGQVAVERRGVLGRIFGN